MESVLIFPHQLFPNHPSLKKNRPILLVEDPTFFSAFSFHKQKLIFHRASLKNFESFLKQKRYKTHYIEDQWEDKIKEMGISKLYVTELDDHTLEKKLFSLVKKLKIELEVVPSPGFVTDVKDFADLFKEKKKLRFETFYIYQRKNLDILLDANGKPTGGKWSFDTENRKKLPKSVNPPPLLNFPKLTKFKKRFFISKKNIPKILGM